MCISQGLARKMRVLVISATFPPMRSGGGPFAFRLCEKLGEHGVDVHVLTSQIHNVDRSPSFQLSPLMRTWSWRELPRLLRLARQFRPDVVDLHFAGSIYHDQPMITLAPVILRRMLPQVRFVTHIEYPEPVHIARLGRPTRAIRKVLAFWVGLRNVDYEYGSILHESDRIVILSQDHVGMLAKRVEGVAGKCVLIPPPPTIPISAEMDEGTRQREREQLQITKQDFVVAFYGLLYPGKGLEVLLEALQILVQRNRPVRLLMIGGENEVFLQTWSRQGYGEELKGLARRLGVEDRVFWSGDCPFDSDRGSRYLRLADACALPFEKGVQLHNSSFSVAASHGLAIVTTKSAATESAFVDGSNVLMVRPKNPDALADRLDSLRDSPDVRRRLQEGALQLTREWFSWDKALEQTMRVFSGEL